MKKANDKDRIFPGLTGATKLTSAEKSQSRSV